jgi:hypothetical protein
MNTFQLFLGRNIPDTTATVTDDQISDFIRFVVQPRFDGFTVQDAIGYWKGQQEQTTVLTIFCENSKDVERMHEIAQLYKAQFKQDSVAIQQLPAMSFV